MESLAISPAAARHFLRRILFLDTPAPSVGACVTHLGYIQMDPLNICGRMHDLILRNRVNGYAEGDLLRWLYGDGSTELAQRLASARRRGFEHYLPGDRILVSFPLSAYPHLIRHMIERREMSGAYSGKLSAIEEQLADRILGELAERGPLTSDAIADDTRAQTGWGTAGRAVKTVLEKLFVHGRVAITARTAHFRRVYDLPERVLPKKIVATAPPSEDTTQRWLIERRLKQRRLVALQPRELRLVEDLVQEVSIVGGPKAYCLRADGGVMTSAAEQVAAYPKNDVRLLAPLDPLIYDRRLTRRLWDFDYTWEVYTPAAKRKRGYYALPVLAGDAIVGHVEPKAERKQRRLIVVSRRVRRGYSTAAALRELARFLGLKRG